MVASLRESGLSLRAIAAATGESKDTVSRALNAGVANATPVESDADALADELIAADRATTYDHGGTTQVGGNGGPGFLPPARRNRTTK